jgi:hypothetical protein
LVGFDFFTLFCKFEMSFFKKMIGIPTVELRSPANVSTSIYRWLPRACIGVESSAEENVVL